MNVKSFEAFTMKDAIQSVKREFGSDAVIISTRERQNEEGGKVYEVRAAPASFSRTEDAGNGRSFSGAQVQTTTTEDVAGIHSWLIDLGRKITDIEESSVKRRDIERLESGLFEVRNLLTELLNQKESSLFEGYEEGISVIVQHLKMMEISDKELVELAKFLKSLPLPKDNSKQSPSDYYRVHAIKWFMKRIRIAPKWTSVMGERQLQVFVGPSGVGKSLSGAKLAATHAIKDDKRVAILSFDDIRLGASEQMRIYAKVIGCPFETVGRLSDIKAALDRHLDKDIIFLDTAGRSPKNQNQIQGLSDIKDLEVAVNFHLVLSMTDRSHQVDRSIKGFSELGLSSLLFTKLDESWNYGEIYNASQKWGIPLSYFGIGQDIPEDLERASKERVIERLFAI